MRSLGGRRLRPVNSNPFVLISCPNAWKYSLAPIPSNPRSWSRFSAVSACFAMIRSRLTVFDISGFCFL